mgnify:CR=1 FL=1
MSGFFGAGSGSGAGAGSGSAAGVGSVAGFFVLRVVFFVLRAGFLAAGSAAC